MYFIWIAMNNLLRVPVSPSVEVGCSGIASEASLGNRAAWRGSEVVVYGPHDRGTLKGIRSDIDGHLLVDGSWIGTSPRMVKVMTPYPASYMVKSLQAARRSSRFEAWRAGQTFPGMLLLEWRHAAMQPHEVVE